MTAPSIPFVTLNDGAKMPLLGLGTWNSEPGEVKTAVLEGIKAGYRHIDCAAIYGNQKEIGEAFSEVIGGGLVKREDLFVTSKLWNSFHGRSEVPEQLHQTLADLRLDYLDLYLIHWPVNTTKESPMMDALPTDTPQPTLMETWEGMMDVQKQKLTRSIGVSNFSPSKLKMIEGPNVIVPAVNQCELHPMLRQDDLLAYCTSKGIHMTAYSPLGTPGFSGATSVLNNPIILSLAEKYKKSAAQIAIRWGLQRSVSVIPKSVHAERIRSNLQVFDFELSKEDHQQISGIEVQQRMVPGVFCSPVGWYKTVEELFDS